MPLPWRAVRRGTTRGTRPGTPAPPLISPWTSVGALEGGAHLVIHTAVGSLGHDDEVSHWVLHVDMDQFLVAVELLRRPELVGLPVVVGGRGDPTERAVVSTASYEARAHGVRSGLALRLAKRRCPDAVFLPVDFPVYEEASARVMETLRSVPGAVVEVLGWDEAFVGVETDDPVETAREIQAAVLEATGLHCSVGIGDTLVRAKIATEFGKPQGTFQLTRDTWMEVMGERPTTALWGVGSRIGGRLEAIGIRTVADLASADDAELVAAFGPTNGPHLGRLGRGGGRSRPDDTPWVARAHGRETTYQADLTTPDDVRAALRELAERVVDDVRKEERAVMRVHLKVRFAPFFTFTKVRKLAEPTYDVDVITRTALELFVALDDDRPVRLLGVRGEMVPPEGGYEPDSGAQGR
jgi:DNA polymerase-4